MKSISTTEARENIHQLVEQISETHEPVLIIGKKSSAVLVSEEDWRSIQETLYLTSIPGVRDLIREGMNTALMRNVK